VNAVLDDTFYPVLLIDVEEPFAPGVTSAIERGMLTALRWLLPDVVKAVYPVASLQDAFDEAIRVLESLGTPFTGDRDGLRAALGLTRSDKKSARAQR
jgi:hypothetical protein